jgi:hypothetical protein
MARFQELIVWQKAHALTLAVYPATRGFPQEERYNLLLARDLGYLPMARWEPLAQQVVEVIRLCKAWVQKLDAERR